jgi:hypothetical protein
MFADVTIEKYRIFCISQIVQFIEQAVGDLIFTRKNIGGFRMEKPFDCNAVQIMNDTDLVGSPFIFVVDDPV